MVLFEVFIITISSAFLLILFIGIYEDCKVLIDWKKKSISKDIIEVINLSKEVKKELESRKEG